MPTSGGTSFSSCRRVGESARVHAFATNAASGDDFGMRYARGLIRGGFCDHSTSRRDIASMIRLRITRLLRKSVLPAKAFDLGSLTMYSIH
jgi:hypothetical protein